MRALTVVPGEPGNVRLSEIPEPDPREGSILARTIAVGVDGTDNEIVEGLYGEAPPGRATLILGHESLAEVLEAPAASGFVPGDRIVAIVRHPDPVPCPQCAAGEWDLCSNGMYLEHGIKGADGFIVDRFRVDPDGVVQTGDVLGELAVLTEPTSVVAKAWDHVERIGSRATWEPSRALIIGAGPLGLLGAMLGVQRKMAVHVLDVVPDGPKPTLARTLGASYHAGTLDDLEHPFDAIIDCTGVGPLVLHAVHHLAPNGVLCLTGISGAGRRDPMLDVDLLNKSLVLNNNVVFGSVNAGRRHYEQAVTALADADPAWLGGLITRSVPLDRWMEALERRDDDVKTVIRFAET